MRLAQARLPQLPPSWSGLHQSSGWDLLVCSSKNQRGLYPSQAGWGIYLFSRSWDTKEEGDSLKDAPYSLPRVKGVRSPTQ